MNATHVRTRSRSARIRALGWLAVATSLALALLAPSATVLATGAPGNNGLDPTGNGTKSNATVGASLSAAGGSATMGSAIMECSDSSVGLVSGSFTLTKTLDIGSTIVVYLVPNTGSDASPAGNVSKNETTVTLTALDNTSGSIVPWSITITSGFTTTSGGILGVFAVNDDGLTAISSSKTNSLNCTEAQSTTSSSTTETTTASTTTETTTASTTTASTTTETTTASTTDETTAETTTAETTTEGGGVEGATGTPRTTLPPTSTLDGQAGPSGDSWRIVLLGMAAFLAGILILAPSGRGRRARR